MQPRSQDLYPGKGPGNEFEGIGEMRGPHAEGRVIFFSVSLHHYVTITTTLLALIFRTVDICIKKSNLKGWAAASYGRLLLPKVTRELTSLGSQITFLTCRLCINQKVLEKQTPTAVKVKNDHCSKFST